MPYSEVVTRSFAIAWRHRYLWLLALFAGEGGGFSFNYSTRDSAPVGRRGGLGNSPDFNPFLQQISDWLSQHAALVVILSVLFLAIWIAFFVLAAVCEGALVRASAEHDAERPFGLRVAWRCGVATMGTILRFRLLIIALALPLFIVFVALAVGLIVSIVNNNVGAMVAVILISLLLILVAIPYAVYLGFLSLLGTRAAVLEQLGAKASIVRAHRLLRKRLGRVLLVWLLSIAIGIVVAICTLIVLVILIVPAFLLGFGAYLTGSPLLWLVVVLGVLILLPVTLIVQGFIIAQASTYWTLAFRRLEIDPAPAYGYGYPQAAPPAVMS
jgi:hypothetical protein